MREGRAEDVVLIGCDILKKEIAYLIEKNGWTVDTCLIPSMLHTDFHKLESALERALFRHQTSAKAVFYGACHPLMDKTLTRAGTQRTPGQNCVEIYLGHELFCRELERGAFFLFEEWARKWREVTSRCFGDYPEAVKALFAYSHTRLLAIRTPCSGDFQREAAEVACHTGLELSWIDVGLEHLEETLARTLKLEQRKP